MMDDIDHLAAALRGEGYITRLVRTDAGWDCTLFTANYSRRWDASERTAHAALSEACRKATEGKR